MHDYYKIKQYQCPEYIQYLDTAITAVTVDTACYHCCHSRTPDTTFTAVTVATLIMKKHSFIIPIQYYGCAFNQLILSCILLIFMFLCFNTAVLSIQLQLVSVFLSLPSSPTRKVQHLIRPIMVRQCNIINRNNYDAVDIQELKFPN